MSQVLAGIKVVEQGTFITGPAAGMLLGDLGADVVKVEVPVTGDPFRAFKGGLYSPHFQTYNRNKRSIALDTKSAADREVFDDHPVVVVDERNPDRAHVHQSDQHDEASAQYGAMSCQRSRADTRASGDP